MNKNLKKIALKTSIIIALLISFNYLYEQFFFEKDLQAHSPKINDIREVLDDRPEILYLGESSNFTFREDDIDKRAISSFINDYFPNLKLKTINQAASHAGIYYDYLNFIPKETSIKTIIVTMNLRSFDAAWLNSDLETALQKSVVLLKKYPPLMNRFLLSFRGYDIKTKEERDELMLKQWKNDKLVFNHPFPYNNTADWDKGMAEKGIKNPDGTINQELSELACHYVKTYSFQIHPTTDLRIQQFDKIVKLAKQRGWNLVFNLLAENTQMADSLVGKELVQLMKDNKDLLINRYQKDGVIVVDNLEVVANDEYIDQNWTTEHYAEKGRKQIAENVANALRKFYPNDYTKVVYSNQQLKKFYNDCEGEIIWGQMQTVTNELAYNGKKSSKIGKDQAFSITYEAATVNLPDSLKSVQITFQYYQNELDNEATIILETDGKTIQKPLRELTTQQGKWTKIQTSFELPEDFYEKSIVKIYVYNPSIRTVYLDNFQIEFE